MLKLKGKSGNERISKEELIQNVIIGQITEDDLFDISYILSDNMGLNNIEFAQFQLKDVNIDFDKSLKLVDKRNGIIYGLLLMANFPIQKGSPIIHENYPIAYSLKDLKQINGFLFFIDERLRGSGFDRKMILSIDNSNDNYDFVWIAVENDLKTHSYWKRLGFIPILTIKDAIFYIKILNNNCLETIYNNIKDYYRNENYYIGKCRKNPY